MPELFALNGFVVVQLEPITTSRLRMMTCSFESTSAIWSSLMTIPLSRKWAFLLSPATKPLNAAHFSCVSGNLSKQILTRIDTRTTCVPKSECVFHKVVVKEKKRIFSLRRCEPGGTKNSSA